MKEKIVLIQYGTSYKVVSLENRIEPGVGKVLSYKEVEDLLLEVKTKKVLTVKIT